MGVRSWELFCVVNIYLVSGLMLKKKLLNLITELVATLKLLNHLL